MCRRLVPVEVRWACGCYYSLHWVDILALDPYFPPRDYYIEYLDRECPRHEAESDLAALLDDLAAEEDERARRRVDEEVESRREARRRM